MITNTVKHVQVRMGDEDYKKLRLLCAMRGSNQQTLLLEVIRSYLQDAPELQAGQGSVSPVSPLFPNNEQP